MTIPRASIHSTSPSSCPTTDLTATLARTAAQLEEAGSLTAARSVWSAAIDSDATPGSQIAFVAFLLRTGFPEEARQASDCLLRDERVINSHHLRSLVRHHLAAALRESGDPARAASLQQMANRDRLICDGELSAAELTASSLDALAGNDLKTAQDLVQRAVVLEQNRRHSIQLIELDALPSTAVQQHDFRTAARLLYRMETAYRQTGNWAAAGTALTLLSTVLRELQRPRSAERCLERARQCFRQAGLSHGCTASHLDRQTTWSTDTRAIDPSLN